MAYKRRMAKSELLSKVAILRAAIGISMKEFADLTGRTFYTWKALEAGRLKLSEELAGKIAEVTGVSIAWLLDDSIKGPPFDRNGESVTPQRFEDHCAMVTAGWKIVSRELKEEHAAIQGRRLDSILKNIEGYQKFNLALFRVVKFLATLEKECAPAPPAPKSAESKKKEPDQEIKASESKKEGLDQELKSAGSSRLSRKTIEKIRQPETAEGLAQSFATMPETLTFEELVQAITTHAKSPVTAQELLRSFKGAKPETMEELARALQAKMATNPESVEQLARGFQGRGEHVSSPRGRRQPQAKD